MIQTILHKTRNIPHRIQTLSGQPGHQVAPVPEAAAVTVESQSRSLEPEHVASAVSVYRSAD
jgi:hypothetical protein